MAIFFDHATIRAYLNSEYVLAPTSQYFKVGYEHKGKDDFFLSKGVKMYAWLTAANPRSKVLTDNENRIRMNELREDLNGHMFFEGSSRSPDGTWEEEGFWICNKDMHFLRNLGEKYGQNAFTFAVLEHSMQLIIL